MNDENHLGVVNDYMGLHRVMRMRADALGISRDTLGAVARISEGHVNKLLSDPPAKNMGITSLGKVLRALGLELVVREDPEQMRKIAARLVKRNAGQVRHGPRRRRRVFQQRTQQALHAAAIACDSARS